MKKLLRRNSQTSPKISWMMTAFMFVICIICSGAFWISTARAAEVREMTPREIIESQLPAPKTLAKASKSQVLSAVCGAVKRFRNDAPQILRVAIQARKEFAPETLKTVLRCVEKLDPNLVEGIVGAAIEANPTAAAEFVDAALDVAPGWADAVQRAGRTTDIPAEGPNEASFADAPTNQNPPPGSVGGGAVDLQGTTVLVCDNGTQVNIAASRLESYLENHQGAFVGNCQATPDTNR